jgi:CHRD domain
MLGHVVYRRRFLVNAERARKWAIVVAVSATTAAIAAGTSAMASEGNARVEANNLHEQLTGYNENPLALSTTGDGQFQAHIDEQAQEISYELSYTGLEGAVTQAHIHFGSQSQVGGISVFLCSNLGNGPAGTQACPAAPATVTGTIRPADVIGPAGQGIAAGQFAELVAAIRSGATYVNVHSTLYPVGEIRAQLGHDH